MDQPEKIIPRDPYRPVYHLAAVDENWDPGDPNGYFFAGGRHHLMYLYRHANGNFRWAHLSSTDLINWQRSKDALVELPADGGCFSGGAFVDEDETAYLTYWIFSAGMDGDKQGIGLAWAKPPYEDWTRLDKPVIPSTAWGIKHFDGFPVGCADPSNIWKEKGVYYLQAGNKCVLDAYGRGETAPQLFRGDWTDLYSSEDLHRWHWLGRYYQRQEDGSTTWDSEDNMCPSFLPLPDAKAGGSLTDKYLELFISHNRGCQYYIGEKHEQRFIPERHGRMSWVDDTFFAPEAAIDNRNRQIMWAWLRDNLPEQYKTYGWSGAYGLPRVLWLREDGTLGMAPAQEVADLRKGELPLTQVSCGEDVCLVQLPDPTVAELQVTCLCPEEGCEVQVLIREDGAHVKVGYDSQKQCLYVDAASSGTCQRAVREEAHLSLRPGEALEMALFLDKSVVEVFANERQAITRRIYNPDTICPNVLVKGCKVSLRAFELGTISMIDVRRKEGED